jgi:hypothetical protein
MDTETRFAVCVNHTGYPVSLDLLKVYTVLDDPDAEQDGMIRIVDESGEDYLYDSARFVVVSVPSVDANALLQAMEIPATAHR